MNAAAGWRNHWVSRMTRCALSVERVEERGAIEPRQHSHGRSLGQRLMSKFRHSRQAGDDGVSQPRGRGLERRIVAL